MMNLSSRTLFWAPRVLSIAFIALISLFALDVFSEERGLWDTLAGLAIHLIPSFVLVAILVLAWRWEWVGGTLYGAAGALYVLAMLPGPNSTPAMKLIWCATIAGPAFMIAGLFWVDWLKHGKSRGRNDRRG